MSPSTPTSDPAEGSEVRPLPERADRLIALLRRRRNLMKASTKGEHLHQLTVVLKGAERSVRPSVQTLATLRANDVPVAGAPDPSKVAEARALVGKLRDASEDVDLVTDRPSQDHATDLANRVAIYAKRQAERNASAWSVYLTPPRVPERNDELLEVVGTGEQIQVIKGFFSQLDALRSQPPTDQAGWDRAATLVQRLRDGLDALESSDMPPTVLAFVKAAAAGGAPLSAYTDEVAGWLSGTQKDRFRVVWDRPSPTT
ncbi:MAG: hypothetical protein SangKO_099930 [Sandaracinaceae bacterium]